MLGPDNEGAVLTGAAAAAAVAVGLTGALDGVASFAVAEPACERVGCSSVRLSRPENKSAGKGTEPEL